MKNNEGKLIDRSRIVPVAIIFVVLCGLSFYMGLIFGSEKDRLVSTISTLSQKSLESPKASSISSLQIKSISFPECSIDYQDYTPCTDPRVILIWYSIFWYRRIRRRKFSWLLSMLNFIEMEEVWILSACFVGAALSSNFWEERMLSSSPRWVQTSNQVAKEQRWMLVQV